MRSARMAGFERVNYDVGDARKTGGRYADQ
jgi:hypothetical protein